ncbi:MAG: phosphotransferase system enzyme I (PtsI) [Pseudoalteromonas tetraodonis]|jgi:phosphotransferase system enzyme I (PtsI)
MKFKHNFPSPEIRFKGIPVSRGIARGPVFVRGGVFEEPDTYDIEDSAVEDELARFEQGLIRTREQIRALQQSISHDVGSADASIFDAHLLVLEDRSVLDEVVRSLRADKVNIESIFYRIMNRYMDSLRKIDDPYLRERVVDIEDVTKRVVGNLTNTGTSPAAADRTAHTEHVLLAHDLTPSDTASMDRTLVRGFATEVGSYTSHTAIIARSLNVPAVVGLQNITQNLHTGQEILLDGYNGLVILDPTEATIAEYEELQLEQEKIAAQLDELTDEPCQTTDGRLITLSANIEFEHEAALVKTKGARGVGLYRTEFLYLNSPHLPSEIEQAKVYTRIVKEISPDSVIFRTMDIGGDKMPAELRGIEEQNPFLGWRGIRVSLERPDVFKTQLRAILRASAFGGVGVMFPLVSSVDEVRRAKVLVREAKAELAADGVPFDDSIEIGAMIEVPSAAITADQIAGEVDFFSIGSNDLIQYTIAVDRVNERVANLYQPAHPAILRLLRQVIDAAHNGEIWVGICGEIAGEIALIPLLVGLGVDELSVGPFQVPLVKRAIRSLSTTTCEELAQEVLTMSDTEQIFARCQAVAKAHYPELCL